MKSHFSPPNREALLSHIADPDLEPFHEPYSDHINQFNTFIKESGEEFEASDFYDNRTTDFDHIFTGVATKGGLSCYSPMHNKVFAK